MNAQNKVRKVMGEFGSGSLRSSSGQKVTNPKQAMAIALSEQRRARGMQAGGSNIKALINRQDTKHGKMDMPYAHLNKYVGKRHGGDVKAYQKGGVTFERAFKDARNRAMLEDRDPNKELFTWRGKSYRANMAAPKAAAPKKASDADFKAHELHGMGKESPQRDVVGEKEKAARKSDANFEAYEYNRAGGHIKNHKQVKRFTGGGNLPGPKIVKLPYMGKPKDDPKKSKYQDAGPLPNPYQYLGGGGYRKLPTPTDLAKGGGIEKRGKTRGAIVRMAAGGSVSARADGIAQRGKTRCKMV